MAYRLFGVKLLNRNIGPTLTADTQQSDPFESAEAKFVFNWLDYEDEAMLSVENPERMNFTCPSDYRGKRSKELALRRSASPLDDKKDEGRKKMDILSEEEVVAKVRKEIVSIAKLAAAICPDQKIFGKRASELMFDDLPEVDMRSRKKSRKLSLQDARQQQQQQQQQMLSGTASNITLEQLLLQRQMLSQVMGSQIGLYGGMYGAIPSMPTNAVVRSISQSAALPTDGASSTCSSTALSTSSLHQPQPVSSTVDSQLLSFLMMQQNMPRNNVSSINGQPLPNRSQFPFNMSSQNNMVSINDQLLNGNIPGQAEQVSLQRKKMDQADKDVEDD